MYCGLSLYILKIIIVLGNFDFNQQGYYLIPISVGRSAMHV